MAKAAKTSSLPCEATLISACCCSTRAMAAGSQGRDWFSKDDMSRIRQWVRSLHNDPLPLDLFIPFDKAWLPVKEFMDTEGRLPTSIAWIDSDDVPDNTFPDPTVRLPGEPDNGWPALVG